LDGQVINVGQSSSLDLHSPLAHLYGLSPVHVTIISHSETFVTQFPEGHFTDFDSGQVVLVAQFFLSETHLPSQQWNYPG